MKTKIEKRVNQTVRKLNKQIKEDVFGDRFEVREMRKVREDGMTYYMFKFTDNVQTDRVHVTNWLSAFEITRFHHLSIEMNDFIITSNFWELYKNK